MTSKRIGFGWTKECIHCEHQCPSFGICYDFNHSIGFIVDPDGEYILECEDYKFDGINRADDMEYGLLPDIYRPDMFKQYRIVVECKELRL